MTKSQLILKDGTTIDGTAFGSQTSIAGEVVFQTGMVGYPQSLTDPSYRGQILVLTYPLIGNYGVPDMLEADKHGLLTQGESPEIHIAGLVVGDECTGFSHWAAKEGLGAWLERSDVPAITGVDTRALTTLLRESGNMQGKLVNLGADKPEDVAFEDPNVRNLVMEVACKEVREFNPEGDVKIAVLDLGLRHSQLRCLVDRGAHVRLLPADTDLTKETYDGLFVSSGPGDPSLLTDISDRLKVAMESEPTKPIFGICLGHQLMACAVGATTYKLKYGNRGHNQPCFYADTQRCFITSQNHGYAVQEKSLPEGWEPLFTNANDQTNEGIVSTTKPFFSAQFHPEAHAGPEDLFQLFDVFLDQVRGKASQSAKQALRDSFITSPEHSLKPADFVKPKKVIILGSGGLSIGQAGEFDYSGSQAIKAMKSEGVHTVLINSNIATVQTDHGLADKVYFLPVTPYFVESVIKAERPDGILLSFGGQTALNCACKMDETKIFEKYGVRIMGTPISAIMATEDREIFNEKLAEIGESTAPADAATTVEGALAAAEKIGYPVIARAAFALGGLGSGFADNAEELTALASQAFQLSPQVLVEKSMRGWKEVEYEVVRDMYDNCITVCNMENLDPLGVHTGESIVVAPSQTLSNREYQMLRNTAIKVIRHLGIVGECNIQYALDPYSEKYCIIEVNARLSRSSALASKATGYPLAYVAAKLLLGNPLPGLMNSVTQVTTSCFEPSLDYLVVKMPRWDLAKFERTQRTIGSAMKSTGEVMAIGRGFEEALQKAIRMCDGPHHGFECAASVDVGTSDTDLSEPHDMRLYCVAKAMNDGMSIDRVHELTRIDKWFLHKMQNIVDLRATLRIQSLESMPKEMLLQSKKLGFCDMQIAAAIKSTPYEVRNVRLREGIMPFVKCIDTVAGEFPAVTNYLFLTYNGDSHDVDFEPGSVLTLGSGVYRIGSSVEFDWSGVRCTRALRKMGERVIVLNYNPETVSTDYDECDKLYFDEISFETVMDIYELENPKGLVLCMGGQIANNIAVPLERSGKVKILGTSAANIDGAENRYKFSRMLDGLGIEQPAWKELSSAEEAKAFCEDVGFPCIIRPSYVLSGAAMNVAYSSLDLDSYLKEAVTLSKDHPVVVSKMVLDAKEVDVDAVAQDGNTLAIAVMEHVENAGVHSGDATMVLPPQDLTYKTVRRVREITAQIGRALNISGPFNIQLIAKDDTLKVIECNVRCSRSLPFTCKTLGIDLVAMSARIMVGQHVEALDVAHIQETLPWVGVKCPQFSFSRLPGADPTQGVDMHSTGEVACFGTNQYEAYLKSLLATGFVLPKRNILLSIGTYKGKQEYLASARKLHELGYNLFGSSGTADFYSEHGVPIVALEWPYESGTPTKSRPGTPEIVDSNSMEEYMSSGRIDAVINLPMRRKSHSPEAYVTQGYLTRRKAIDCGVPLITDIKCAKFFAEALRLGDHTAEEEGAYPDVPGNEGSLSKIKVSSFVDSRSTHRIEKMRGFVDIGAVVSTGKGASPEFWKTESTIAVANGITTLCVLADGDTAAINALDLAAKNNSCCDYAVLVNGSSPDFAKAAQDPKVLGVQISSADWDGSSSSMADWRQVFEKTPAAMPVIVHADAQSMAVIMLLATLSEHQVHMSGVTTKDQIEMIRDAKAKGLPVTCDVVPSTLLMAQSALKDINITVADQESLWENMDCVDCFSSGGNQDIQNALLPMLMTIVAGGRMSLEEVADKMTAGPNRIFGLPQPAENGESALRSGLGNESVEGSYVEVDLDEEISAESMGFKASQLPFGDVQLTGKVLRVTVDGSLVSLDSVMLSRPSVKNVGSLVTDSPSMSSGSSSGVLKSRKNTLAVPEMDLGASAKPTPSSPRRTKPRDNARSSQFMPVQEHTASVGLPFKHVLSVTQLKKEHLSSLFDVAHEMMNAVKQGGKLDILSGRVMAAIFYEPSTRTLCSFQAAMERLGGSVISLAQVASTSVAKGESLSDFVRTMESLCDITVLRHPEVGAVAKAALSASKPLINAGDGSGEHPTQALLDAYTMRDELGTLNGITVTFVGDLKHSRTVHSLVKLLKLYNVSFIFVSPPILRLPEETVKELREAGHTVRIETSLESDVIKDTDAMYVTRVQKERFATPEDYEAVKGSYQVTASTLVHAKEQMIVMHPLPRVDELHPSVDSDPRAAYFRQVTNGMYVRMALLAMCLGAR